MLAIAGENGTFTLDDDLVMHLTKVFEMKTPALSVAEGATGSLAERVACESERLLLREFSMDDLAGVQRYACDMRVVEHLTFGPNNESDSVEFLRRCQLDRAAQPRQDHAFAIVRQADSELVGSCGLHLRPWRKRTAELGYCLAYEFWGNGYAREAVAALVTYGFESLDLHRICAVADPENVPSLRLLERLGFRREGHLRKDEYLRGQWRDSLVYAVLADEWRVPPDRAAREPMAEFT